ncbi:hypothetical protein VNI00_007392 [Paramarasmius palmivorus]|uniref:BRCT domain-containing protein n=1 Tax=Paramarasmius palmivorus TaxID=297713 RepID=A0AAW0D4D5_9AGAR
MLGSPLQIYIEKDVQNRDSLISLITKHGGTISPGYSHVPYILVDPLKPSGQSLYRQYAAKKGKIVLNAQWVNECIKAGQLQTFHTNWAGCKVTGNETASPTPAEILSVPPPVPPQPPPMDIDSQQQQQQQQQQQIPAPQPPPHPILHPVDQLVAHNSYYPLFPPHPHIHSLPPPPRDTTAPPPPPPQSWQPSGSIAPQQTHISATHPQLIHRPSQAYREDAWTETYNPNEDPMVAPAPYDYRYREEHEHAAWGSYYDPGYDQAYDHTATGGYLDDPNEPPPTTTSPPPPPPPAPAPIAGPSTAPIPPQPQQSAPTASEASEKPPRGRKRTRQAPPPAVPPSTLVNRHPPARSPTPPTRVIKSTYGGNLFTAEDIQYLKRYIDYSREQGLVLSLREICERIAIKAPHHSFYSWRRYCNKHRIKLGGYTMSADRSESPTPGPEEPEIEEEEVVALTGPGLGPSGMRNGHGHGNDLNHHHTRDDTGPRNRSPTPPRVLHRSTTGKGVAFTNEDIQFLIRFMEYRKSQGRLDMVAFWKDVATKAPHHSRASWMKYWRRHKHELDRTNTDDPMPTRPDKKMRYSREDDVLLAKFFCNQPEGTSDKVFQAFGRQNPHHPWKGWQEHHRIHKAKIDYYIKMLKNGESIDDIPDDVEPPSS